MAELNTVCISTDKYDRLKEDSFLLKQSETTIDNLLQYQERLEQAVIEYIAKQTEYGRCGWMLREEFGPLVNIMNLHAYDWSKHRPNPITSDDDECEELIEEIQEGESDD